MILPGSYANGFAPRDGEPLWPELWRGCVGAWNPGLGPSGTVLRDWSPFKNHGTLTDMDPGTDWVASQGRYALDFDGSNDHVLTVANDSVPTTRLAISAWMYQRTNTSQCALVSIESPAGQNTFTITPLFMPNSYFVWTDSTTTNIIVSLADHPKLNEWNHVGFSWNGSQISYFLNGSRRSVTNYNMSVAAGSRILIGRRMVNAAGTLDGLVDDVQVYGNICSESTMRLLASRRGIAYDMIPHDWSASQVAAYRARYYSQVVGSGVI